VRSSVNHIKDTMGGLKGGPLGGSPSNELPPCEFPGCPSSIGW